jgi:hypothetical protein
MYAFETDIFVSVSTYILTFVKRLTFLEGLGVIARITKAIFGVTDWFNGKWMDRISNDFYPQIIT